MARLTGQSRLMFSLGTMFCLVWGFLNNWPHLLDGDIEWVIEGMLFSVVTFTIACAIRKTKVPGSWNSVAHWFLWLSLILPGFVYWAGLGH
jgi:hypothetical protein